MNLVSRKGSHVVIRQIPGLLLFVTGLFGLPPLAFSLFHILRGTDADGKFFSLFLGLFILWLFLEFVATREVIKIDLSRNLLTREVRGVFRNPKQVINLGEITGIGLETKMASSGTKRIKRQYLYLYKSDGNYLLNSPTKVYLNHGKLGKILSEVTGIPYRELADGF